MTQGDHTLRAYATLVSLRDGVPDKSLVNEKWVHEYNAALQRLSSALSRDLSEFTVRPEELQRAESGYDPSTDSSTYREGLWCDRAVLMQRLHAVLTYFTGMQEGKIGFDPS